MHFARATSINPNDADTMMNKAIVLALEGKSDAALEMAQFAIRLNPRWERAPDAVPEVRAILAAAYIMIEHPQEARRHMKEFLRRFSRHWAGQPSTRIFITKVFFFREVEDLQRVGDALRQAGMPD
jgi:adenylate cyclase